MYNLSVSVPENVLMIAHSHGTTFTGMEGNRTVCLDLQFMQKNTHNSHSNILHMMLLHHADILVLMMLFVCTCQLAAKSYFQKRRLFFFD
jgi:hypothetical protein